MFRDRRRLLGLGGGGQVEGVIFADVGGFDGGGVRPLSLTSSVSDYGAHGGV